MNLWRPLRRGLRVLSNQTAADQDAADEVRHYFEQATNELIARGLSPDEARRAVRLELGTVSLVKEQVRSYGWEQALSTVFQDLRIAGRMLRKNPLFTMVAVLCISLGSGAVTTIFSAMNALVLRPLGGASDAAELVRIERVRPDGRDGMISASYRYYEYLRDRSRTLDGVAVWGKVTLTLTAGRDGGTPGAAAYGNIVSGNFFDVLGVRPLLGRFFVPDEDQTELTHPIVVISEAFWRSHLGADRDAVGRTISISGHPYAIVGVAPAAFQSLEIPNRTDAWIPLSMQRQLRPKSSDLTDVSDTWLRLCGRLRRGQSRDAAHRELSALTVAWTTEAGEPRWTRAYDDLRVSPLTGLPPDASGPLTGFLAVLLGAASLVLLIASVNVASLLSARGLARQREMAVRSALGAARARLVRQQLTEILLLFFIGALGGVTLAFGATRALAALPISEALPTALELSPDLRVLAFALLVSLVTGVIVGLAPALRTAQKDISSRLRADSAASSARTVMNRVLIVGQLALSLTLLVAAGLFLRAFDRGSRVQPGFDAAGVAVASFNSESWGYDEARARAFYGSLRDRLAALPGVSGVSYAMSLPLTMQSTGDTIQPDAAQPDATPNLPVRFGKVDTDYFDVIRLPIPQGRAFSRTDTMRAPSVAIVNETFARRCWPHDTAIGRTFRYGNQRVTIVGVARDAKYSTLSEETPAFVYFPLAQSWEPRQTLLVRAIDGQVSLAQLAAAIQGATRSLDPALPQPRVTTLLQENGIVLLPQRVAAIVTGALGALGLLLATVGLYGIVASSVSRRTRELAIRMAVGAYQGDVLRLIVRDGMRLTGMGVVIGWLLALATTRVLAGFLFDVSPLDIVAFAGMSILFVVTSVIASYLPARRATAVDPVIALRGE